MTEGTFKKIDRDGGEIVGPAAVLLCGYSTEDSRKFGPLLSESNAKDHRVLLCSKEMIGQTLEEALSTTGQVQPAPPDKLPRVVVLSGMSGAQIQDLIDNFSSTGLPRPIFAVPTLSNLSFTVRDLLVELLKEYQAMAERRRKNSD